MRRSFVVLGVAAIAGLGIPPIAAAVEKRRHPSVGDAGSDEIALSTIFDGAEIRSTAAAFRGGTSLCWYGGQLLDLRGAALAPEGATLDVRCLFGGLRVVVPETWRVLVRSKSVFGVTEDASSGPDGDGPLIIIDALSVFGGTGITTKRDDEWGETLAAAAADASATADAG
jgi:hypothetical protein